MPKDYYLLLGISTDSSQREIKAAYRRLAKEYHPDRCSDLSMPFLGIQEAYAVLGDPERRREYDNARRRSDRLEAERGSYSRSFSPSEKVEPLIPEGPPSFGPGAAFPRPTGPEPGSLFDLFSRSFLEPEPDRRGETGPMVEVSLTPQQAFHGGVIRLLLPLHRPCRSCGGRGGQGFFACPRCGGTGSESAEYPLRLGYPAGVGDNTIFRVGLERFGLGRATLTIRFRIRC